MEPLTEDDPSQVGPFQLLARIGAGGMGKVYLGESPAGSQVAVKVIKPSVLDVEARDRFVQELANLRIVYGHLIADLVDGDAHAEHPWLAMEYVPGPDLNAHIAEHGPLPVEEVTSLGALLAEGLKTVHEAGLLHRDLKPQNVLLDGYGPKVIDFGLAILAERRSTLTASGFVVGSVRCMPPEQARGERELTTASDIYSLAAVLLFAATGHYPYSGETWQAVALNIEDPAVAPDLSGLPPELAPLITEMLMADEAQRPKLADVTSRLVDVFRALRVTPRAAKQHLTSRVAPPAPLPELPDPEPVTPKYSPTLVDPAASAHEGPADSPLSPQPDPDAPSHKGSSETGEAESSTEKDSSDRPSSGSDTPLSARRGRRPAPLRAAELLRASYAADAPFAAHG